jgi:DNA polymerase-3 subunit delta
MIFALVGPEALLVKRELDKILSERLTPASKDFNCDVFEGADVSSKRIAEIAGTLPVLAPRRVIVIRNAHELKKAEMDRLAAIFPEIPETTDVILTAEKSDGRTGFWQMISKKAKVKEFKALDPRQAPQWVTEEAFRSGYRIAPPAVQWLVSAVGSDLNSLQSALAKLYLLKGKDTSISLEDVESCVTAIAWKTVFELMDAVGARNLARALTLYQRMEEAGESPIAMLALLARHFRILSKVKEGDSAGVPPFFLKDYQRQAGQFDVKRLKDKRERIFQTDRSLKSSPLNKSLLFERLLMDLCR